VKVRSQGRRALGEKPVPLGRSDKETAVWVDNVLPETAASEGHTLADSDRVHLRQYRADSTLKCNG
jgi:hypothetical protein